MPMTLPLQPSTCNLQPESDVLIRVSGVSKKFCLSLKKSLWYGLCDMGRELTGRRHGSVNKPATRNLQPATDAGLRPKEFWAVHDVDFELRRGECLGLIGRNGAGKTTLLKMLNGLIKPDAGRIEMRGRVGALISLGAGFNGVLTGRENIYTNASVVGLSREEIDRRFDEIVDFAEIGEFIDMPVQSYSSGMAVRLGFAIASSIQPDILLLDEVLAVGDLGFKYKCFQRIGELMERAAVVFVSHDMASVSQICTQVMLLDQGHIQMASADGSAVIQRYNDLFKTGGHFQTGTGEVELSDLRVVSLDPRSAAAGEIRHGEDVAVEFTVEFRSAEPRAVINVTFLNQANAQVAQCISSEQRFYVDNRKGPQRVRMVFPKLPFNPGQYSLWMVVGNPKGLRPYAVRHGACPFRVVGSHVGWIPIQPIVSWSVEPLQ